jgi:hypothetical protein
VRELTAPGSSKIDLEGFDKQKEDARKEMKEKYGWNDWN